MPLNTLVCIKQVPDPQYSHRLFLNVQTGVGERGGVPSITNPHDRNAIEAALSLKDTYGGKITAITMGPPAARRVLEDALALGVDEGVILCDHSFAGSDTLATARIIASGVRILGGFDLILCGEASSDSATHQVPGQLAVVLDIPHVASVQKFHFTDSQTLLTERRTETDILLVESSLPVLLALCKGINEPRLPTVAGIIAAAKKNIREICATDCFGALGEGENCRSFSKVVEIKEKRAAKSAEILAGEMRGVARELLQRLKARGVF